MVALSLFVWRRLCEVVRGTRVLPRRCVGLQAITVTVQPSPAFPKEWADLCKVSPSRERTFRRFVEPLLDGARVTAHRQSSPPGIAWLFRSVHTPRPLR